MPFIALSDGGVYNSSLTTTHNRKGRYVQSVNDSGNVTKNCQEDVDEEISTATTLEFFLVKSMRTGK
jgi:hypothetical protein